MIYINKLWPLTYVCYSIHYCRWTAVLIVVTNSFLTGTMREKYGSQVPIWTVQQASICFGKINWCLVLDKGCYCCHDTGIHICI